MHQTFKLLHIVNIIRNRNKLHFTIANIKKYVLSTIALSYQVYFIIIEQFLTVTRTVIFTSNVNNLFILSATKDNSFYRKVVGAKIKNGVKTLK